MLYPLPIEVFNFIVFIWW